MALADLPDGFVTFSRDELETRYKRDYLLRNPEADVVSGQPDLDAKLAADLVVPVYFDARLIADGINEDAATGSRLDLVGNRKGLPRGAASGASGYVAVKTAAGGSNVQAGDELENPQTRKKYESADTKHVDEGTHVRVRAKSKGPETDVAPGAVLRWTSPRPGLGDYATVVEQSEGRGLTGGAEAQNDARYLDAIRDRSRNPIGGDNDAELVATLLKTPDVPIEQVFTYPGAFGPGSSAFTFTVLAPQLGASRLPTTAQVKAALDWIAAQMPGDGSYFPLTPTTQALALAFAVTWAIGGWADATPWPATSATPIQVASATGPLNFVVTGSGPAPIAGNTVAVWNNSLGVFSRKRLSAVSGAGPYTLTCTSDNGASDTTYTPLVGQRLGPWSDNLTAVPAPVLGYLATLGPGELFSALGTFVGGRRKLRTPTAPKSWPYATGNRVTVALSSIPEVADATAVSGVGQSVTPTVPPRQLELSDLTIYPS